MGTYTKCFHCGADNGLHHYETDQCPLHGIEETRDGHKQQWASTTFLDAESVQLENAAPQLRDALKVTFEALKKYGYTTQPFGEREFIKLTVESALRAAGEKI